MTTIKWQILKEMPIFGAVDDKILALLVDTSIKVEKNAGEYFFKQNDASQSIFVLLEGKIQVIKNWKNIEYKLREFGPGNCFGEMALMDLSPRSASALSIMDSFAMEITVAQFQDIYNINPDQYTLIQMNMGREVCRRLKAADDRILEYMIEHSLDSDDTNNMMI